MLSWTRTLEVQAISYESSVGLGSFTNPSGLSCKTSHACENADGVQAFVVFLTGWVVGLNVARSSDLLRWEDQNACACNASATAIGVVPCPLGCAAARAPARA